MSRALVFGGSGVLGTAIVDVLRARGWTVDVAARHAAEGVDIDLSSDTWPADAASVGPYEAVAWAQGLNLGGGVLEATREDMHSLYDANVVYVTDTLKKLVGGSALAAKARGVVVSSVWQIAARSNKLAYVASKSALAGVVPAIAIDLGDRHFSINGVLPGVIDTPMTRSQLSQDQLRKVESETIGGALATPEDVGNAVAWLLDPGAAGINGQWIAVDNGWSVMRSV